MPSKHKRHSLTEAFDGLDIESSRAEGSSNKIMHLGRSIRLLMSSTIRGNGSIRTNSVRGVKATFSISMDNAYDYNILGDDVDPDDVHVELQKFINDVADGLKDQLNKHDALDDYFNEKLSQMVYGSNMIENVGAGLDITLKLCRAVFQGEDVTETDIGERDAEYQALKVELAKKNLPNDHYSVLRSRREIVQHAKAAHYIISQVAIAGNDLSEQIILETHRLLTYKIDTEDGTPWDKYSGKYRKCPVRAGFHSFMHENMVPSAMRNMINSLEADIKKAAENGEIDPVALASKYCHTFVNIHPFQDGNGRVCRLILNAILLKYGGGLICIGQSGEDRVKYLSIATDAGLSEASQDEETKDLPDEYKPKHYKQLASFTLKHARDGMHKIRQIFKRDG